MSLDQARKESEENHARELIADLLNGVHMSPSISEENGSGKLSFPLPETPEKSLSEAFFETFQAPLRLAVEPFGIGSMISNRLESAIMEEK